MDYLLLLFNWISLNSSDSVLICSIGLIWWGSFHIEKDALSYPSPEQPLMIVRRSKCAIPDQRRWSEPKSFIISSPSRVHSGRDHWGGSILTFHYPGHRIRYIVQLFFVYIGNWSGRMRTIGMSTASRMTSFIREIIRDFYFERWRLI